MLFDSAMSNMMSSYGTFDSAIDRVLDSWDDRVSAALNAGCINELSNAASEAQSAINDHSARIQSALSEMEAAMKQY